MFIHICSCVHCTLAEHLVCIQVCLQCCSTSFRELHTKVRVFLLLPVCVSDVHVHSVCAPQTECLVVDLPSLGPWPRHSQHVGKLFASLAFYSQVLHTLKDARDISSTACQRSEELGFWSSVLCPQFQQYTRI